METKLVTLTEGNIKNTYIRLTSFDAFLPADVIGGRNIAQCAPRTVSVDYGGALISHTDIDGVKRILRDRKSVRAFMQRHRLQAGDQICITRTGTYSLQISVA